MDDWHIPGYVAEELLGFGATGEVWRARRVADGEVVAVKRLRHAAPSARERLRQEAAVLGAAAGPHVVAVHDVVDTDGEVALVMDLAAGGSLAGLLAVRGPLAPEEVVTVVAPLAGALAAAHDRGLVHGDVTPANVLFAADGRPLLVDFGVVPASGDEVQVTPEYADPAVLHGAAPSAASDVFGLAAVGYAALSGEGPWESVDGAPAMVPGGPRRPLAEIAPQTPPALVAALDAALADDPRDRPSARELAAAVLRSCAAAPVGLVRPLAAPPAPLTRPVPRASGVPREAPTDAGAEQRQRDARSRARRWPFVVATAVAVLVAIAVGLAWGRHSAVRGAVLPPVAAAAPTAAASRTPSSTGAVTSTAAAVPWPDVVSRLEAMRTAAYDAGDVTLLAAVYAPGSPTGGADMATLRALTRKGMRVDGFSATVRSVTVRDAAPHRATLDVVDVLGGYRLVDGTGQTVGGGASRPARSVVMTLVDAGGTWRIASVAAQPA